MNFVDYKERQLNSSSKYDAEKIQLWCAYQERSHHEVRLKLQKAGLKEHQIDQVLSELITENYLNEERFAIAFAGGKFRIKQWGRIKIKNELKKHRVSERNIRIALESLDEKDYQKTLRELTRKKITSLGGKPNLRIKAALYRYLLSKGFEPEVVMEQINRNFNEHES